MQTKLAKLKELAAANDWRGALRLAASFARLGDDKAVIVRGHEAFGNARFAVQLGRDPAVDIAAGIAALCARYEIALPVPAAVAMPATDFFPDRRAAVRAADRSGLDPALLDFRKGDAGWFWVDPATTITAPAAPKVDGKAAPRSGLRIAKPVPPPADRGPIDPLAEEFPVVRVDVDVDEGVDENAAGGTGATAGTDGGGMTTGTDTVVADTTPPAAPVVDKAPRANARRDAEYAAAASGDLPTPPDFTAPTHKGYRRHLAEVVALVEAGDVSALRAYPINPASSSRRMLARYRDAAVIALQSRG